MSYVVKTVCLDAITGKTHTETTWDGRILKKPLNPKHPARLLGQRVRLANPRLTLYGGYFGEDGDCAAYVFGELAADSPVYKTYITVKVKDLDILSLKWDGFVEAGSVEDDSVWKRSKARWEQLFNAQQSLAWVPGSLTYNEIGRERQWECDLSGTLTLTEIGERYRVMGDLLHRKNCKSLYTLKDIEIKGGLPNG